MCDVIDRGQFLKIAVVFEGGLLGLALLLGWLTGVQPFDDLFWQWSSLAWGIVAALSLFLLFLASQRISAGPLLRIKQFLIESLGPPLAACTWYDLIGLAIFVGFSEELMFRGFLQPWLESWGPAAGLIGSNVLFGLAHSITPLYAVLAGVTGIYLGILLDVSGERNLLVPMVTHALYDYLAFLVVIRTYRSEQTLQPVSEAVDSQEAVTDAEASSDAENSPD